MHVNAGRFLVAMLLLGAVPTPSASPFPITADDVTAVRIEVAIPGDGPRGVSDQIYVPDQNYRDPRPYWYVAPHGRFARRALNGLLFALADAPVPAFDFDTLGITYGTLANSAQTAGPGPEKETNENAAWIAFRDAYMDVDALRLACTRGMQLPVASSKTDPRIKVTVVAGATTIVVSTSSTRPYMLPLQVTGSFGDYTTWDPRLSDAIAYLAIGGHSQNFDAPRALNGGNRILENWAYVTSLRRDVTVAINGRDTIGDAARAAAANPCVPQPNHP